MVIKRPVRPSEASSDSDDPLDVIGPSAPPSPPQSRQRSTPARPPPSTIKRSTPSAKYIPRQQVPDDDEDLPKSASRSSFAKRRRVLSDSEEEPEIRDGSPKNLARFVADLTDREGDARDHQNGPDARIGDVHAREASVPRPKQRNVVLSDSEKENAAPASKPDPLPDDEDAFGLFTSDRSSSPPPHPDSKDHIPTDGGMQGGEGQTDSISVVKPALNESAQDEVVGAPNERGVRLAHDEERKVQEPREEIPPNQDIPLHIARDPGKDNVPANKDQYPTATDLAVGEAALHHGAEGLLEEVQEEDAEADGDQVMAERPNGMDGDHAMKELVGAYIGTNGTAIAQDGGDESSGTYPDKAESVSMKAPGSSDENTTADPSMISAKVHMDEAVFAGESGDKRLEASDMVQELSQEPIVREEHGATPIPTNVGASPIPGAGIEAESASQDETDKMQSLEDKAIMEPAESAEAGLVLDPMESPTTKVAVAEDQPVRAVEESGVADRERMELDPSPGVSSKAWHEGLAKSNDATSNTDVTPAPRPILPQTPQSITKLPSLTALQPTSSLSTLPNPSPGSSPSIQQNGSGFEAENTAPGPVSANDAGEEEEQEEGEEEIDPEDIEMEEEAEPESKPSKSSKSSASEPAPRRDKSESTSTAAESRDTPAPAPALLNSKGQPRGKPGRKPGWKVGDPLIKERKALEARAKLGLDKEEEKKLAKGGKKGKVEALKSAARGRSVSFSEISEPAGFAADSKSVVSEADDNGDDDDTIYCSCGKSSRADGNDTLVGCDGCDSWFHAGCVGLSEDEIELIDTFFCTSCEKATGQKTTMKKVCKRSGCDKQFSNRQSKFCSSACAFQHSQTLIATMQNKKQLQQLASALAHYPPPPPDIRVVQHLSSPQKTFALTTRLYNPVEDLERRITETQSAIDNLEKRILISGQAIEACETLPPLNISNGEEAGKKKRKPGGGDDRPCGWVEALIWADEEVGKWASEMPIMSRPVRNGEDVDMDPEEAGGEYCMNPRKRCDRHSGWRTIIPESFGKELSQAQVLLASLVVEKNNLMEADNAKKAGKIARDSLHELLALRLAKTVV